MSWACDVSVAAAAVDTYQYTGATFLGAVQSLLAAQCALLTPAQWPPDRTDQLLHDPVFDFVVVGAGSAGAVVANRLSEVAEWRVLLVEAGGLPNLGTEIPPLFFGSMNTSIDWGYKTESQENACLGYVDNRCYWPRGRVLGGSSSINGMFYVRGNPQDYNEWEEAGNRNWSYKNVLPYFKKSEDVQGGNLTQEDIENFHGTGGYLRAEIQGDDALEDIILKANKEVGIKESRDINGISQMGTTRSFSTTKEGRRMSTARAFLSPIKDRPNLYLIRDAMATEIIFKQGSNVVKGIKIRKGNRDINVYVSKEVIISGGTINSAQLLMLSGIGPANHLRDLNIEVKKDLSVGFNLQDHPYIPIYFTHNVSENSTLEDYTVSLFNYLTQREGSLTSTKPSRVISFINTKNITSDVPDILYHFYVYQPNLTYSSDYFGKSNFKEEVRSKFEALNKFKKVLQISVTLLHPQSRGIIQLRNKNPCNHPLIYPNYFNELTDLNTIIAGMKRALDFENTKEFKKRGIKLEWLDLESCKGLDRQTDAFLECWAREMTSTSYHPVGTNKMGPASDPESVVDSELKVHGVKGLRVIDASIIPVIVKGNTNAPVIMIAEKGSDMIKSDWL